MYLKLFFLHWKNHKFIVNFTNNYKYLASNSELRMKYKTSSSIFLHIELQ